MKKSNVIEETIEKMMPSEKRKLILSPVLQKKSNMLVSSNNLFVPEIPEGRRWYYYDFTKEVSEFLDITSKLSGPKHILGIFPAQTGASWFSELWNKYLCFTTEMAMTNDTNLPINVVAVYVGYNIRSFIMSFRAIGKVIGPMQRI